MPRSKNPDYEGPRRLRRTERKAVAKAKEEMGAPEKKGLAKRTLRAHAKNPPARRKCKGLNAMGAPCKSPPLKKGTEIEGVTVSGDYCLCHDPSIPEGSWRRFWQEKGSKAGSQALRSRPRALRPFDIMADAIEKAPGIMFRAHLRTLGYELDPDTLELVPLPGGGAKIVGFSREGYARVSKHDDLNAMRQAEKDLADRLYGKPRQAVDVGAGGSGMVGIVIPQTAERARVVLDVLQESGAIQLPNGNGNGNHAEESVVDADVIEEP
jgi:hypothetical protein